ncbi:MAG: ABC transporter ATP-binding protein/permease [Lachnospiraceae bacterium]|nr:ABC transporter ATP-binding protein/permease [Lachnospiraceae bacterium]
MKSLLKYIKDYKKESILAPLFKMLEASFELMVPLVMAAIIDNGIANSDTRYIFQMGAVLVLLAAVGLASSVTAQYFSAKAAVGFATKLRNALFSHIQGLSYTELDTIGTSTLITRMTSDVNQIQNGVNLTLRLLLRSPFIVFGAMVMAFTVDVQAALIFVVTIPLLAVVVFGIMLVSMPLYKKVQAALDKILGRTRENLAGARVIRAFCNEESETADFEQENELLLNTQVFVGKISAAMNPVTYIIINIALVVLLWTGAVRVDNGIITQGEVVALVNYMSQILVELVKMANLIIQLTKALACAKRVEGIFGITSSMENGTLGKKDTNVINGKTDDENAAIMFEHVSLTYSGGGDESLTDIDFVVKKGETVGIIGGTGSGKTSVVNLIPRFYDATKGRVIVDGFPVRDYEISALREKIGVVPQKAVLFKGTIRENLLWGNENATEQDIEDALRISQAKEFVDTKDGRLDFMIAQGGKNLSGGQKQRLTIARAIVRKPGILILDDSASALDFATDAKLRAAVKDMGNDMTVIIVSQRAASIQYADKIVVMDDGAVAGIGTHEQLLADNVIYQEIYYSQFPDKKEKAADEQARR